MGARRVIVVSRCQLGPIRLGKGPLTKTGHRLALLVIRAVTRVDGAITHLLRACVTLRAEEELLCLTIAMTLNKHVVLLRCKQR